jgi:glycine hydroxymethyltransferase
LAERLGLKTLHVPVDQKTLLVDVGALGTLVRNNPEVRAVILDQSFKIRRQPIAEIRSTLPKGVLLTYDCSHDGALIAGGAVANPLLQGADILHGNTHKTIAGPQRAFIGFRDPQHPLLKDTAAWVCPNLQSNCHAGELGSMLVAFKELEMFGRPYARQIVENAKALAEELRRQDLLVSGEGFGFTETHQVWLRLGAADYAIDIAQRVLPEAGVRTTNIQIPGTNGDHGLRLGTQALTRRGFKPAHCREAASLIARVLRNESPGRIRAEVCELLSSFPLFPLHFSFDDLIYSKEGMELINRITA